MKTNQPKLRWKFLKEGRKSEHGNVVWKKGVWKKAEGELELCENGFHCSDTPYQAFSYVQGPILAQVETRGEFVKDNDKSTWREMRVVKTYAWTKKDSVALAIYSAELCLPHYEKLYKDKAPRLAIEAAKRWLKTGSRKGLSTASSAAWSAASSAWSAARSAAWSAARSAARSAEGAASSAWSAASSAWSAARSAVWSAAWSATSSAVSSAAIAKITKYFDKLVKNLK